MTWFHGGIPGLEVGGVLTPAPPHVTDGCLVCVARAEGRTLSVGAYRAWLQRFGDRALPLLEQLEGVPDDAPMDPPSAEQAVYITRHLGYARWYAARSGHGDLYEVEPLTPATPTREDHFPSATCDRAVVVGVVQRSVRLTRQQRRELSREWEKRDRSIARRSA